MVKIHTSILSSPQMQGKINKVLSMDYAKEQAAEIDNLKNPIDGDDFFTPLSGEYQKHVMNAGASGQIGIVAYSNDVVFHSLVQQNAAEMSLQQKIYVGNGRVKYVPYGIRFGNIQSDGKLGKVKKHLWQIKNNII